MFAHLNRPLRSKRSESALWWASLRLCSGRQQYTGSTAKPKTKPALNLINRSKRPKVTTALDAVSCIRSNDELFLQMGVNTPQ